MYVWDETKASRAAQEVALFIFKHTEDVPTQKHLIAYSDACSAQSRNTKVKFTWIKISQFSNNNIETIVQKFLVCGHFFLPNGRDFGLIEMRLKKTNYLCNPEHYYELVGQYRRRNMFSVQRISHPNFISTKPLEESTTRRFEDTASGSVAWLQIQWVRFLKNEPYKMFYKTPLDD